MKNIGTEFIWWFGIVEDRDDPLQLGRVRVRCYGHHTDDKNAMPKEDLPWAQPVQDITSAAMGDVGQSATGLVEGSWVVGFFLDGKESQRPVIMGSIAGIPTAAGDPKKGFNDPNPREDQDYVSVYPRGNTTPADNYEEANEKFKTSEKENDNLRPDTNRLARNANHPVLSAKDIDYDREKQPQGRTTDILIPFHDKDQPYFTEAKEKNKTRDGNDIIGNKVDNKKHTVDASLTVDSINTDVNATKWSEPKTNSLTKNGAARYSTSYPKNHVYESESGHIREYDDTDNATRIHERHRAGTFYEIDHDGNKHTRIVGNNYEVIAGTNFINVKGDVNLTIDSNCKTYIKGDWEIQVDGNKTELVRGNHSETVQGNQDSTIIKNVTETYGTETDEHMHNTTVNGKHSETITNTQTSAVTGAVTENYSATHTETAGGNITITGPRIDLNP